MPPVEARSPSGAGYTTSAVTLDFADALTRMLSTRTCSAAFSAHVPNPVSGATMLTPAICPAAPFKTRLTCSG